MREVHQMNGAASKPSSVTETISKLSIFNKPRIASQGSIPMLRSENVVYNGIGGTTKVLQSDLKKSSSMDSFWQATSRPTNLPIKKKKLSPSALGK